MHRTWDAPRVTRALNALKDNGISVRDMTKMSGANRSTVYRWMSGGDGQPDYALVNNLARAVWRKHPDLARELVEASGYAWAEPSENEVPAEPLVPPEVIATLQRVYKREPDRLKEAIEALEAIERERRERGAARDEDRSGGRRAG